MAASCTARGFTGKLPSRGDFVSRGLPRGFIEPWDAWLRACLPDSRDRLGDAWRASWLEAPVWRFALAPGLCGPDAALGVWVPSVDRVGRDFPLAVVALAADWRALLEGAEAWLDIAEAAACEAVTETIDPDQLLQSLGRCVSEAGVTPAPLSDWAEQGALWWTRGAPRVRATRLATHAMPDAATFVGMLHSIEETA